METNFEKETGLESRKTIILEEKLIKNQLSKKRCSSTFVNVNESFNCNANSRSLVTQFFVTLNVTFGTADGTVLTGLRNVSIKFMGNSFIIERYHIFTNSLKVSFK